VIIHCTCLLSLPLLYIYPDSVTTALTSCIPHITASAVCCKVAQASHTARCNKEGARSGSGVVTACHQDLLLQLALPRICSYKPTSPTHHAGWEGCCHLAITPAAAHPCSQWHIISVACWTGLNLPRTSAAASSPCAAA